MDYLSRLTRLDTTELEAREIRRIENVTTEGASAIAYYDHGALRLIAASFFGETGRAIERFYLGDTLDFVAVREEIHYRQPITSGPVEEKDRTREEAYYCGGKLVKGSVEKADDLRSSLSIFVRTLSTYEARTP